MSDNVIGSNLKWLKKRTGISTRGASLRAGLSESAGKHMITGRSKSPQHDNLEAVARVYGITAADLANPDLPALFESLPGHASKKRPASSKPRMAVRDLTPGESYTTNDPDELALLDFWQQCSRSKRAAIWFELAKMDLPSLREPDDLSQEYSPKMRKSS